MDKIHRVNEFKDQIRNNHKTLLHALPAPAGLDNAQLETHSLRETSPIIFACDDHLDVDFGDDNASKKNPDEDEAKDYNPENGIPDDIDSIQCDDEQEFLQLLGFGVETNGEDGLIEEELPEIIEYEEEVTTSPSPSESTIPTMKNNSEDLDPPKNIQLSILFENKPVSGRMQRVEAHMLAMDLFVCKLCQVNTGTYFNLQKHVKEFHWKERYTYIVCCQGNTLLTAPLKLYHHIQLHINKDAFKCKKCGKYLDNPSQLELHIKTHHRPPPSNPWSVVYKLKQPDELEKELEKHMLEKKLFTCKWCKEDLKTFFKLRDHVKERHQTCQTYFICCNLPLLTSSTANLFDHVALHVDKDYLTCKECNKEFKSMFFLTTHTNKIHRQKPELNQFICELCGKGFSYEYQLQAHIDVHNKKRVKCQYCEKGKQDNLKISIQSLLYQKLLFISELTEAGLKTHIEMYHEVKITHLCYICGRGFPSVGRLNSHISDHGGPHGGNRKKKPKINSTQNDQVFTDDYFKQNN